MKKNLLQEDAKNEIISRINKLSPESQREWGKMNVNQMLRHISDGIRMAYGEIKPTPRKIGWIQQKLMRFIVFNTNIPAPKGKAVTFPEIDTVERGINPPDFKAEKEALQDLVKTFPAKPLHDSSAMFGPMTKENWGRLNYGHIDHHLRQFGV